MAAPISTNMLTVSSPVAPIAVSRSDDGASDKKDSPSTTTPTIDTITAACTNDGTGSLNGQLSRSAVATTAAAPAPRPSSEPCLAPKVCQPRHIVATKVNGTYRSPPVGTAPQPSRADEPREMARDRLLIRPRPEPGRRDRANSN
jgi:hypothetical protein